MSGPAIIIERWNRGEAVEAFTPEERAWLRNEIRAHPSYTDAKARDHAAFVQDARALYEADFSNQPEPNPKRTTIATAALTLLLGPARAEIDLGLWTSLALPTRSSPARAG